MSESTFKELAEAVGKSVEDLRATFAEAGLGKKSDADVISAKEKMQLLEHLRSSSGKRVAVRRKKVEKRKVKSKEAGGAGTINIEVRKKRTVVKKAAPKKKEEPKAKLEQPKPTAKTAKESAKPVAKPKKKVVKKAVNKPSKPASPKVDKQPEVKPETPLEVSKEIKKATAQTTDQVASPSTDAAEAESSEEQRKHTKKREELHVTQEKRGKRKLSKRKSVRKKLPESDKHKFEKPTKPVKREVEVYENILVKDLAQGMAIKGAELIKQMFDMGMTATINQALDQDTATLIVEEVGHTAKPVKHSNVEDILEDTEPVDAELKPRAPVVTVMGHVDHGKTSLLDYIRKAQVADSEQGGITQHIGAYRVVGDRGEMTFLDTPGHAAFTAMRARGAKFTDIIVLVVAADDSVMPQTIEAIEHAKAAETPIIVALNKIDKQGADVEKVKGDLAQHNVVSESWGGDTIFVEVSAKTGEGIDNLLEAISLQAEVMELQAPEETSAAGVIIESRLDKGRGALATILVQRGRLKKGDILLAGREYGRVRMLFNENDETLDDAKPSTPAQVLGLSGVPEVGEQAIVVESERKAKEVVEFRRHKDRESKLATQSPLSIAESFLSQKQDQTTAVLKLLLKADVQGSAEALRDSLLALDSEEVKVEIISTGIGAITESDINLAAASGAAVIGFNVRADNRARNAMRGIENLSVRYYGIIYEVIDDVKQMMTGLLEPEVKEEIIGVAEVKEVFRSSKFGAVAGCQVVEGNIKRGCPIRVLRDNVVVYEGQLESLRRFKDEVEKVAVGSDCGIAVKDYNDVKVQDSIEVYERTEVARTLNA